MTQKLLKLKRKITDHNHDKYITTPEFNKLSAEVFNLKLKQADLVTKTDFDGKLRSQNQKKNSNETKHLLVENELKKLKTFNSIYFRGKAILKKMVRNIIQYFNRHEDILKELLVLVIVFTFTIGNLKDCLMKELIPIRDLTMELLHT